jgi:hypothetical protein
MKYTVATCAHLLAAPQWRLIYAELDAGAELKVAHGRQANRSRHDGRHEAWARVRDAKRWGKHVRLVLWREAQGAGHAM